MLSKFFGKPSLEKNKEVNILYYDENIISGSEKKTRANHYSMKCKVNTNMGEILEKLYRYQICQRRMLERCFGDIYTIISKYLPQVIEPQKTYIYIHKYLDIPMFNYVYTREYIPNSKKVKKIITLPNLNEEKLYLRVRKNPIDKDSLKGTFIYN